MTWRDFSIYTIAWQRNQILEWERTRKVAHVVYSTVVEKNKWKSETIWMPLPTDYKPPTGKPLSPAEIKKALARYN